MFDRRTSAPPIPAAAPSDQSSLIAPRVHRYSLSGIDDSPEAPKIQPSTTSSSISSAKSKDFWKSSQTILHRTGWDPSGRVEDIEDEPSRMIAGLKLKYRYPIPLDLLQSHQYAGYLVVRQWLPNASVEVKWKEKFVAIKDNKAYLLKNSTDKVATSIIKLDDCLINPTNYGKHKNSFSLIPPPGAINETNKGKEIVWIMAADSESAKEKWIFAFLGGARWREKHINRFLESGESSVAPSSAAASPSLSRRLELLQADTVFPFPAPDASQQEEFGKLDTLEGLKLICAPNARFFKNVGLKSPSTIHRRHSGGRVSRSPSIESKTALNSSPKLSRRASSPGLRREMEVALQRDATKIALQKQDRPQHGRSEVMHARGTVPGVVRRGSTAGRENGSRSGSGNGSL
ncbi:hypothetical protein HDU83_001805 [Entophlyctis luteolus]|nr:hypothetical protein HDU83_001805 [Entophlyctis luteolus]